MRQILITAALPYANGDIHLGHLLEHIQTDIWARAMRSMGHDVKFVCADDAHGTAIMLKAKTQNITPEALIDEVRLRHMADFAGFLIQFDHYHSTHSDENRTFSTTIYRTLNEKGYIKTDTVNQLFDQKAGMFLADRFVKGQCPKCHAPDQYGDNCEVCASTYSATDLINPVSTVSGDTPVIKPSLHYFFDLPQFESFLQEYFTKGTLQTPIQNKLNEWFESGLQRWDISRDAPYFGFLIPDTTDKYFYVWLDAPIGYMASFKALCQKSGIDFDHYWHKDSTTELYHFIGKDIVYFHALFWPAMLHGAGYRTPTGVFAHGFVTVNGQKMSKSRGTFIQANTYLKHLNPEYLRYYFASKLGTGIDDINLDFDDFIQKVNSDLVGKVVNIASRLAPFLHKYFDGNLYNESRTHPLLADARAMGDEIGALFEAREFSKAIRAIMSIADNANEYIDTHKPWQIAKNLQHNLQNGLPNDTQSNEMRHLLWQVCSLGIQLFYQLIIYLAPIVPDLSEKARLFLQVERLHFADRFIDIQKINPFHSLLARIDKAMVDNMIEDSKQILAPKDNKAQNNIDDNNYIGIDDFAKVQMKVAKVLECNYVDGADKLLSFSLDVGEDTPRQVFSGIRAFYEPCDLIGKKVICVTNLAPRKMKFGISSGMILSAGDPKTRLVVITLPDDAPIGATLA